MSSMNQRFRNFVGSKRRNPNTAATSSNLSPAHTAATRTVSNGASSTTSNNSTAPSLAPPASLSTTSLAMNPNQHAPQHPPGRPPSYQYANQAGNLGAPNHQHMQGRAASPMPPPAVNTGTQLAYVPQHQQQLYNPPPPAPPGYPMQQQQQQQQGYGYGAPQAIAGPHPYQRGPMAEVEGSQRTKAQLIVGIDFGTTFSGVAFAFATNTEAKEDIIVEWPGAGIQTKQKIPTVLYYDQHQQVVGWGPDIADALAPTGYPKPGVQKVEWFKLQLMLSGNTYIDPINL
ncbi:hypothetical protein LTR66_010904, partial [Elasticomyces elasticus]